VAGSLAYLWRSGNRPWQGNARRWLAQTRRLSAWFTGAAVVGQLQVQAVAFVVTGPLGPAQLTTLRLAQTLVLQPVQNLVTATLGLIVPRSSRLAAARNAGGLRRQTATLALLFLGLAAVMLAVVLPLARLLLPRLATLAPVWPLAVPIGLQAAIYLLQIPFSAAMRGMHRARALFIQYALFTVASLTGLVIGAGRHSLPAAVWGLTIGAFAGLLLMIALYRRSIRRL
jgi:O-antigen/teichoic acid export membrane protein